jgi:hypothetical protein
MTESTDIKEYEPGDFVHDADADHDKTLVVIDVPDETAEEHVAYVLETGEVKVADDNPEYPDDADVIVTAYINDEVNDKGLADVEDWRDEDDLAALVEREGIEPYAFPAGRLEPADDPDADPEEVLEKIRAELESLGWDTAEVDPDEGAVVVEKFGTHLVYPDGTVKTDRETFREKLETAVADVV